MDNSLELPEAEPLSNLDKNKGENGEILKQCIDLVASLDLNTERKEAEKQPPPSPGDPEPPEDPDETPNNPPCSKNPTPSRALRIKKYKEIVYYEPTFMQGTFLKPVKKNPIYSNLKLGDKHGKLYWEVLTAIKSIGSGSQVHVCGDGSDNLSREATASSIAKGAIKNEGKEISLREQNICATSFLSGPLLGPRIGQKKKKDANIVWKRDYNHKYRMDCGKRGVDASRQCDLY